MQNQASGTTSENELYICWNGFNHKAIGKIEGNTVWLKGEDPTEANRKLLRIIEQIKHLSVSEESAAVITRRIYTIANNALSGKPATTNHGKSAEEVEEENESAFVDKLVNELPQYGIDTSQWSYKYGDCCYGGAVEFIARCIEGFAEEYSQSRSAEGWINYEFLFALKNIIREYYLKEKEHYDGCSDIGKDGHIFCDLAVIKAAIERAPLEPTKID